ncbi:sugar transferase [Pontibaca salina]|uniref:Sugar transferase n=1 Tax=Pontibaca salina TaxID=2795731 RepID=A0A934HUT2_9RHOB|nr:sugar transferase [Pontibaca salina]MBI6630638.1 sugar transferase [Pontibaca salina]
MSGRKRLLDLVLASVLAVILMPLLAGLLVWLALRQGRPLFHVAERMQGVGRPFWLWKLRTMTVVKADCGVSGGDKAARITPTGRWLRARRLDELPQLWNILRGDLSFVGPRPPLRQYVERHPALYARVLQSRPGVTGLATLVYHRHEAWLLARCTTAAETDAVYGRNCVPRKARLDLIYQRHQSLCFDLALLLGTAATLLRRRP